MATYVEKFAGYIADVPKIIFRRCDGKKFIFDELDKVDSLVGNNI